MVAAVADLAAEYGTAIVAIRHLRKSPAVRAIYRGLGTVDLAAAARSVLLIAEHPHDPALRAMAQDDQEVRVDKLPDPALGRAGFQLGKVATTLSTKGGTPQDDDPAAGGSIDRTQQWTDAQAQAVLDSLEEDPGKE